jgi:CspA family cold shock protein
MLWSPTIWAALLAATPWLDVYCPTSGGGRSADGRLPSARVGPSDTELRESGWILTTGTLCNRIDSGDQTMARGTVKWFNSQKGYGFIQPQGGGKDVFVHISAVEKAGLAGLNEGQAIEYEEVSNRGKTSAENLKVHR